MKDIRNNEVVKDIDLVNNELEDSFAALDNELSHVLGSNSNSTDSNRLKLCDDDRDDGDSVDLGQLQGDLNCVKKSIYDNKDGEFDFSPAHHQQEEIPISDSDDLQALEIQLNNSISAIESLSPPQETVSLNVPEKGVVAEMDGDDSSFSSDGESGNDDDDLFGDKQQQREEDILDYIPEGGELTFDLNYDGLASAITPSAQLINAPPNPTTLPTQPQQPQTPIASYTPETTAQTNESSEVVSSVQIHSKTIFDPLPIRNLQPGNVPQLALPTNHYPVSQSSFVHAQKFQTSDPNQPNTSTDYSKPTDTQKYEEELATEVNYESSSFSSYSFSGDEDFIDEEDDFLLYDDSHLYSDEQYESPIAPDPPTTPDPPTENNMYNQRSLLPLNRVPGSEFSSFDISTVEDDEFGPASQLPNIDEIKASRLHRRSKLSWKNRIICCVMVLLLSSILVPLLVMDGKMTRIDNVMNFLNENKISKLEDLKSHGTPQNKAAIWIADKDKPRIPISTGHTFLDRYILAVLYFSLGGDVAWADGLNFLQPGHVCNWGKPFKNSVGNDLTFGIHGCRRVDEELVPIGISLAWHALHGTIPPEIKFLSNLELLILQFNPEVEGTLPSAIQELTKLRKLSLEHCFISGSLPDWIGDLTELTSLGLGNNLFVGNIPDSIANLTGLQELGLDNNSFNGDLQLFGALTNLRYLYLDNNSIGGQLTSSLLEKWEGIQELDLSGNDISGTIPDFLFSHKSLKVLDLHANILTGSIPSVDVEINDTFEFLALYENDLSDRVPSSISSLISLRHMDLSKNSLIGNLPASIATMKNLKYLFIGNNEFSDGTIPGFLTEMEFLEELSIWDTNLKGVIPEKFGDLSNLVYLDLSKNQLVGSIPENFGMLTHLEYLLMRDNVLTGTLPSGLGNLNIKVLLLEANEFTGDANMICQSNLSYFGSDCGGSQPEIQCNCCTICCEDGDIDCNDLAWEDRNLDPRHEYDYKRLRFDSSEG